MERPMIGRDYLKKNPGKEVGEKGGKDRQIQKISNQPHCRNISNGANCWEN